MDIVNQLDIYNQHPPPHPVPGSISRGCCSTLRKQGDSWPLAWLLGGLFLHYIYTLLYPLGPGFKFWSDVPIIDTYTLGFKRLLTYIICRSRNTSFIYIILYVVPETPVLYTLCVVPETPVSAHCLWPKLPAHLSNQTMMKTVCVGVTLFLENSTCAL